MWDIYLFFISIEVCEIAREEYTNAECPNTMSNRRYDLSLLLCSMGVSEKQGKTEKRGGFRDAMSNAGQDIPPLLC